jgi:hypothetical protein
MSCSGSEISVCRWLLDLRCIVYHLANNLCATQQQGVICGLRIQGVAGEEKSSKGADLSTCPLRDGGCWATLSNIDDMRRVGSCSLLGAARCRQAASDECRTPSTFGRITVHPQDAASGKPPSRKAICVAWKQDVRHCIGERSGRTASWNVTPLGV